MLNTPRDRQTDRHRDRETKRDRKTETENEFRYATNYYTKITGRQTQAGRALVTNKI